MRSERFEYKQVFVFESNKETLKKTRGENNLQVWLQNVPGTVTDGSFIAP
jgi:hypothetical protein